MTQLINNFLNNVHTNFLQKEWCGLNATGLTVANYQNSCEEEYYLLKYFPAYLAEYYIEYKAFFEKMYSHDSLNIVSIGCGAGIDYHSLSLFPNIQINYTGIDVVDWQYRPDFQFLHQDISTIDSSILDDTDLFVFPKILTELSDDTVLIMAEKIVDATLPNEIYFLVSYITDESSNKDRVNGKNKFKIVCDTLIDNGWKLSPENILDKDNSCSQHLFLKEEKGIRGYLKDFVYPPNISELLINLKQNCNNLDTKNECIHCNINTFPMMNSKYIAFNILKFIKNDN